MFHTSAVARRWLLMRLSQAAAKSTPVILGSMSTITGGVPMRKKLFGSVKSFAASPATGAPNATKAAYTALLFSSEGSIKISMSLVARGCA
jgi:hypothetical protein